VIRSLPKLLGVQAEGARAVVDAFRSGGRLAKGGSDTIADSIAVGTPRNWRRAVARIRASGGTMLTVSDEEIAEAMRLTARLGGVFGEPAGVAGVAGLHRAVREGVVRPGATAVAVITGNGLKDIRTAKMAAGSEHLIDPDLGAVEQIVGQIQDAHPRGGR
jgi:threonine synthase